VESNADDHEPRCVETTAPHVRRTLKMCSSTLAPN